MDTIYTLAKHIIDTRYEDLPSETVHATKRLILDGLAVALGGSGKEGVSGMLDLLRDWGGKAESTAWIFGDRLPATAAAQVNSLMMHALDYDDVYDKAVLHCGVVAIPVALALAERMGGLTGKKFINAVALGSDVCSRLTLAVTVTVFELGWHYTTLHGSFNGAAVAGKLLGLDEETLVSALGLAYHQAGGNYQGLHDGVLAKRVGPAFSSRDGITAALLAQRGVTGARNVIDGKAGLYKVYHRGNFDPKILLKDLGKTFEVVNLSLKPYPCCRGTHPSIDGALGLAKKHNLRPDDIEAVKVNIGKGIFYLVCEPIQAKQNPKTVVDAQFSIPWVVAWALRYGKVGLGTFTPEAIRNKDVLALSNRVTPVVDDSLHTIGLDPAVIEVTTRSGKKHNLRIDTPYGSPENPMSFEAIREKMLDCVQLAARPVSERKVDAITDMVVNLEKVKDVRELVKLLA
jgi:2-methylcitrate dehydratase PrpD